MNFEQAVNLINSLTNSSLETYKQFCANQEKILKRLDAIATPTVKPMVEDLLKNDFVNYPDANYVAAMACEGLPTWVDFYGKRAVINFAKQLKATIDSFPLEDEETDEKGLEMSKIVKTLKTLIRNAADAQYCAENDCAMAAKALRTQRIELIAELPRKYKIRFNSARWLDDIETTAYELLTELGE